jgi:hypothetical protein
MTLIRALIRLVLLATLASSVQGEEFWGRKLPGQPTQFIFGYGSLINSASRNATASQPISDSGPGVCQLRLCARLDNQGAVRIHVAWPE